MLKNFFEEITVKIALHSVFTKALLATVLLLNGCTTYVDEVRRDTSYSKKLTQTSVVWTSNSTVQTRITRSGGQGISDKDRTRARKNIAELQDLFAREVPTAVPAGLRKNAVEVLPYGTGAATQLKLTVNHAQVDCTPGGCQDSLWLDVSLFDTAEQKSVWSGRFKVGAPYPLNNDAAVVASFTETLVSQLKAANLL